MTRQAAHHGVPGSSAVRAGFVLVTVLAALVVIAGLALTGLLATTLDSLATRNHRDATLTTARVAAAVQLALAEREAAEPGGLSATDTTTSHGPWPQHGLPVTVLLEPLALPDGVTALVITTQDELRPELPPDRRVLDTTPGDTYLAELRWEPP